MKSKWKLIIVCVAVFILGFFLLARPWEPTADKLIVFQRDTVDQFTSSDIYLLEPTLPSENRTISPEFFTYIPGAQQIQFGFVRIFSKNLGFELRNAQTDELLSDQWEVFHDQRGLYNYYRIYMPYPYPEADDVPPTALIVKGADGEALMTIPLFSSSKDLVPINYDFSTGKYEKK